MKVAVIGGGAAGFFSAISVKNHNPNSEVTIFEKSPKTLAKVLISGGGRCNVTNSEPSLKLFLQAYPRGNKLLRSCLNQFNNKDLINWFESKNLQLKTEPDGRVFPVTDKSETIANCLLEEADRLGISIQLSNPITKIEKKKDQFLLTAKTGIALCEKVIVASGGSPKKEGLKWLNELGHVIINPVPSLFTFNIPKDPIRNFQGLVAPNASVVIEKSKIKSEGPILITHWGLSGPAVLKLSSFCATELSQKNYEFKIHVSWLGKTENDLREYLGMLKNRYPKKQINNTFMEGLPARLGKHLIAKSGIATQKKWQDLGKKDINKLIATLGDDIYEIKGKTTFKEEFVTAGGISLKNIDFKTLQSKVVSGMYFAGEVLDIDGITGGFNFQAAWSTGYVAGKLK